MPNQSWISPQKKKIYHVRNATSRIIHWIVFVAVSVLILTGYYIGNPTFFYGDGEAFDSYVMGYVRLTHYLAAMALTIATLLRIYLAFFSRFNRDWIEMIPTPTRLRGAALVARSYFDFRAPPFYLHIDPLDGLFFLLFLLLSLIQIGSGFALYLHALPIGYWWGDLLRVVTRPIHWMLGSDQNIRFTHHINMWIMLAGVIAHVYMQVTKTIIWRDGHIASIFGGFKFRNVK